MLSDAAFIHDELQRGVFITARFPLPGPYSAAPHAFRVSEGVAQELILFGCVTQRFSLFTFVADRLNELSQRC